MDGCREEGRDGRMNRETDDGWMDGKIERGMDGWREEGRDGRMNRETDDGWMDG